MPELVISPITDEEISWASELLGLGPDGFATIDRDDSRQEAIRRLDTCDFEACPGSGKTTLLVAKLAILASRWPHRQRGICVLSHTNAARDEIDRRMSGSGTGCSLVRYPHYIGTIHGFVNEFFAIPWLRSKGNPVRVIDTALALKRRYRRLSWKVRTRFDKNLLRMSALEYDKPDYSGSNKGSLSKDPAFCRELETAARLVSGEGLFTYDEMFVWAHDLLDRYPEVVEDIRSRFPLVFIDEAQDNSELQSKILHRVFIQGDRPSIRQRFGDSNQAIYRDAEEGGAQTDQFPAGDPHNLPRSYRFSQDIADVAKGFGVVPQALIGAGPCRLISKREALPPVIFLFDDGSVRNVLPSYAEYLLTVFSAEDLSSGTFTAIAATHELQDLTTPPIPRAMNQFAPHYNPVLVRASAPTTFQEYLSKAYLALEASGNASVLVNAIASALFRLSELAGGAAVTTQARGSSHRQMRQLLHDCAAERSYLKLLDRALAGQGIFNAEEWKLARPLIEDIVLQLTGVNRLNDDAETFLGPEEVLPSCDSPAKAGSTATENFYHHPPLDPKVRIRLGSIHSVKGETHTATLVLESYYHKHHLSQLKPWLLLDRSGGLKVKRRGNPSWESPRTLGRLKLHYVAMTRPSHQLCLAMRHDAFVGDELNRLKAQGWCLVDCRLGRSKTVPLENIVDRLSEEF